MSEKTIKNCLKKCGFGNPNVVADGTVDHEFEELLQELSSNVTVEEFLKLDDCVDTCEPEVNTSSVDIGEKNYELNASNQLPIKMLNLTTIVLNPKTMKKMKIDSKSAVNSGEALEMLEKLQFFLKRMMQRTKFHKVLLH